MTVGWGTIAYALNAGGGAGVASVYILFGGRRRKFDPLMVSFGAYGLLGAIAAVITVRMHQSSTVGDYERWFKPFSVANLVAVIGLVVLVATWTRQVPRWALAVFGVASVVIGVFTFALPNGLLQGDIVGLRDVSLLGERFALHEGTTSPWRPLLDVYLVGVTALLVVAIVRGFRSGRGSFSTLMVLTLTIGFAFAMYDNGVDLGVFDTPYLGPFGLVWVAIAGAVFLAERGVRIDQQLHEQATRLEETVIERTAALIEANRRLEGQLNHQQRSARNLALLTAEFERSNGMVDPTPADITTSLHALLGQLATILRADEVELRMDDERLSDIVPRSISWHEPTATSDSDTNDTNDTVERIELSEPIITGNRHLGMLVARSVEERDLAAEGMQYLGLAAEYLAGLIHRLELVGLVADSAVETERQRIAMDLHDSVTQRMYSVSFLADAAVHQASVDPTNLADPVRRIRELVLSSLAELRALLLELRPKAFNESELAELIEELADNVASTCDSEVVVDAQPVPPLPARVKTALYRISQEALSNACRHSGADRIIVSLRHERDTITLRIHDNGVGFDPTMTGRNGSGLDNLLTRAQLIDADIDIASELDGGTTISIQHTVPFSTSVRERAAT